MTYFIIRTWLLNLDCFLSSSLKEVLLLAAYTTSGSLYILYPFIHMYVHIWVHKDEIILRTFSTKACFYTKKIWNMCGNAWLAFDLISPMTVGVNYHMIFLPPFLDGVNFLLKDDLSFKKWNLKNKIKEAILQTERYRTASVARGIKMHKTLGSALFCIRDLCYLLFFVTAY